MAGLVRQPWRRGDVADGPQALDIGAAHFVGLQETALVHGDAQLLEADILRIGDDADGDDHMAEFGGAFLAGLVLQLDLDTVGADLDVADAAPGDRKSTRLNSSP